MQLLHYRAWRGRLASPFFSVWPIARVSLAMIFRRWMFWILFGLAMLMFCLFFFGQYLLFTAESQLSEGGRVTIAGVAVKPDRLVEIFRMRLKFNGSGEMYSNFIWYQGYMTMIVLALAGSILVGNDFRHGSLAFYLSKPLKARHYLAGKFLAVGVLINMLTTIPAVVLFVQYGLLDEYDYFSANAHLLTGILCYGAFLTVVLGLLLLATAVAMRRTVPLIMTWTALFFFFRRLAEALVDRLGYDPRWKLIDLWNSLYLVGQELLRVPAPNMSRQPELIEVLFVLGAVSFTCLIYLIRQIRAVEIVK